MARPRRVLLSGFEPFGGSPVNPSEEVVRRIAARAADAAAWTCPLDLATAVLPVVGGTARGSAWEHLLGALLAPTRPFDAVILLGEAHTRGALSVERVAVNLLDYRVPDNAGHRVVDRPVVPGAPAAHFATLPVRALKTACEAADVPCELSTSAGTFLCNETMFRLLDHAARAGAPAMAGFVHLPQLPEQRALRPTHAPAMPLEVMERGVLALLRAVAEFTPSGGGRAP
jgi:pyroglutamyl-peptidase